MQEALSQWERASDLRRRWERGQDLNLRPPGYEQGEPRPRPSGMSPPSRFVALPAALSCHPSQPAPLRPVESRSRIWSRPQMEDLRHSPRDHLRNNRAPGPQTRLVLKRAALRTPRTAARGKSQGPGHPEALPAREAGAAADQSAAPPGQAAPGLAPRSRSRLQPAPDQPAPSSRTPADLRLTAPPAPPQDMPSRRLAAREAGSGGPRGCARATAGSRRGG